MKIEFCTFKITFIYVYSTTHLELVFLNMQVSKFIGCKVEKHKIILFKDGYVFYLRLQKNTFNLEITTFYNQVFVLIWFDITFKFILSFTNTLLIKLAVASI